MNEHYSTSEEKKSSKSSTLDTEVVSVEQKMLMTQLLIAVIVEFTEPHFVRTSKMNQEDQMHTKKSKTEESSKKATDALSSSSILFSNRAVDWAKSCLSRLLKTTISTNQSTHIAELDALLGATGENHGLKLEEMVQQSLLCGLMGARSTGLHNM